MTGLKKEFFKTSLTGFLIASIVIGFLYFLITEIVIEEKLSKARLEAKTIIYYRHYLAQIAPKVKINDSKISPFSLTPAYVTDRVAEMFRKDGIYIKQVSDKYRVSYDKPNKEEIIAINYFKKNPHQEEYYKIYPANDIFPKKHVFYAKKLIIEKSCLECHGVPYKDVPAGLYKKIVKIYGNKAFNYKLGDVRGILSIVFPYQVIMDRVDKIFMIIISIGILFFVVGLIIFYKLNDSIDKEILKFLEHFKNSVNGKYPIFKDKMKFIEFENLKKQINKTFFTLKRYEGEVYKNSYYNKLTMIPNRTKFLKFINDKKYIVVLLNIDKFKDINFFFGVNMGNKLIVNVSQRLKNLKKQYNFKLFHLDIDEFAMLFSDIEELKLRKILEKILCELEKPYDIEGNEIIVRFRMGVSFYEKDYIRADIALDMAKELNKDIVFGKEVINLNKYEEHLKWLGKIKKALENDRIIPYFQPIVNGDGIIVKYEALVRLIDEDGNIISPFLFLEIAKKSRLYLEITKKVIKKVVEKINEKNIAVSVNLTLEDMDDEEMRKFILNNISGLKNKKLLTFEIVENESVGENKIVKEFLTKIKNLGALIYIDDFGSGYSNFDYLIKLRPDGVKIDGSLIKNILTDQNSEIIVKTIILFAKEMNIKTIAEFVENEEIFNKLKELGIDYFQGYYFSPPKPDIK